jgi:hypothetical protein
MAGEIRKFLTLVALVTFIMRTSPDTCVLWPSTTMLLLDIAWAAMVQLPANDAKAAGDQ